MIQEGIVKAGIVRAGLVCDSLLVKCDGGDSGFHHELGGPFTDANDWIALPGSDAHIMAYFNGMIRMLPQGGMLEGIITARPIPFDPTKWYRITAKMNPNIANVDGDGGDLSVEAGVGQFEEIRTTMGWGLGGMQTVPIEGLVKSIVIAPGILKPTAHIRILAVGYDEPFDLYYIHIEEFDHDPRVTT